MLCAVAIPDVIGRFLVGRIFGEEEVPSSVGESGHSLNKDSSCKST